MCGDFEGDCFKFVNYHIKMEWIDKKVDKPGDWEKSSKNEIVYSGHVCTAKEIPKKQYDHGHLFICPPRD